MKFFTGRSLRASVVLCHLFTAAAITQSSAKSEFRKVWAEATESDWMSPVAGRSVRLAGTGRQVITRSGNTTSARTGSIVRVVGPNGIWEMLKRLGSQRLPVGTIALA
jgi:hypothetical protein